MTKKFFYILPSYNESLNLYELLSNFKNFYNNKKANVIIVIIDDGSNDNSLSIIKKFTKKNKTKKFSVKTLIHKKNLGLGRALKTGFEYCFLKGFFLFYRNLCTSTVIFIGSNSVYFI